MVNSFAIIKMTHVVEILVALSRAKVISFKVCMSVLHLLRACFYCLACTILEDYHCAIEAT